MTPVDSVLQCPVRPSFNGKIYLINLRAITFPFKGMSVHIIRVNLKKKLLQSQVHPKLPVLESQKTIPKLVSLDAIIAHPSEPF